MLSDVPPILSLIFHPILSRSWRLDRGWVVSGTSPLSSWCWTTRNTTRGTWRTRGARNSVWHVSVKLVGVHDPHNFRRRKSKVFLCFLVSSYISFGTFLVRGAVMFFFFISAILYRFNDEVKSWFVAVRYFLGAYFAMYIHRQVPSFAIRIRMTCAKDIEKVLTKKLTEYTFLSFRFLRI